MFTLQRIFSDELRRSFEALTYKKKNTDVIDDSEWAREEKSKKISSAENAVSVGKNVKNWIYSSAM